MPNQFLSPEGDLENYFVSEYWLIDQYIGDKLWNWGSGYYGKRGTNTTTNALVPVTTFAGGTNWKQVSCGPDHTSAIKIDGTLWTWGRGSQGQLGNNQTTNISTPVTTFAGGNNWKQVSSRGAHTAAIKTDGTLWVWGYAPSGQLGINSTVNKLTPVTTFAGGNNWKQVSGGASTTAAIKTDGTLWVCGSASSGQIGNGVLTNVLTPVTTFAGGTNWKQVNTTNAVMAIKTDGTLWTWGIGTNGVLGNAATTNRSTPVTTFAGGTNWKQLNDGNSLTVAIKTDGTLWTWGLGSSGQLGNGQTASVSTPVTTFAGGTNWKQVSSGYTNTAAIKTDGTLWTWGSGGSGQLGINSTASVSTPVTTSAGGTNWKQVSCSPNSSRPYMGAVTSGEQIDIFDPIYDSSLAAPPPSPPPPPIGDDA